MNRRNGAFLLFEVTLAIAILSLGLVFVVRSISVSMRVARQAFNYSNAIGLLSNKEFEVELESELGGVEKLNDEGKFRDDQRFSWKYSIEKLSGDSQVGELALDVSWKEGKREGGFGIVSYVRIKE